MLPSSSAAQLAAKCAGSAALDHAGHDSPAADKGTDSASRLEHRPGEAVSILAAVGLPTEGPIQQEEAYAYNVDTGAVRHLGHGRGAYRAANIGEREIPGTPDLTGPRLAVDFKAGRAEFVAAAEQNYQLAFAALVAGSPPVTAAIVYTADEDDPWKDSVTWDALDLAGWAAKFRDLADKVQAAQAAVAAGKQPELTTGAHCRYCPAVSRCPAMTGLATVAMGAPMEIVGRAKAMMGDGHPEQAWALYKATEAAWKKVTEQVETAVLAAMREPLYALAWDHGIPLGNGKMVRAREVSKRYIDGEKAQTILTEAFGPEAVNAATTKSITQSSLKAVLGAAETRRAMKILADNDALTIKVSQELKEVADK
mgnify:FL=1